MRRRRGILGLGLLALLALSFGFFPQASLRRFVEARLGAASGGPVHIGRFRFVPATLTATAQDVRIESDALRLRIAEIRIVASPKLLLGSGIVLRTLAVRGLDATLRPTAAASSKPPPEHTLGPIVIERVELTGAQLRFETAQHPVGEVVLAGLNAEGAVGRDALQLGIGAVRWERSPTPLLGSLRASVAIGTDLVARLSTATFSAGTSRLTASGSLGSLLSPAPELRLDGDLQTSEIAALAGVAPVEGRVQLTGHLGATGAWDVEAVAARLIAVGHEVRGLKARASQAGGALAFGASGGVWRGRFALEGNLREGSLEARADASGLSAAALAASAGASEPAEGSLSGVLELRGPLDAVAASATLQSDDLRVGSFPIAAGATLEGTIALESRSARLAWEARAATRPEQPVGSTLRIAAATLEASGNIDATSVLALTGQARGKLALAAVGGPERSVPYAAEFAVRDARLEKLAIDVPDAELTGILPDFSGRASLRAELSGPLARPSGSAHIEGRELAWREAKLGESTIDAEGRFGLWTLDARLPEHGLQLAAQTRLAPDAPPRVTGTLLLAETALEPFAFLLPAHMPAKGRLQGRVAFEGPLHAPTSVTADTDLRFDMEGSTARLSGRLGANASAPLDLRIALNSDLGSLVRSSAVRLTGALGADLLLRGTLAAPHAEGELRLTQAALSGEGFPELGVESAVISFSERGIELQPTTARVAEGSLTLSGRYPLAASEPAALHAAWSGIQAGSLLKARTGSAAAALQARLGGRADLTGRGPGLLGWRGDAVLTAEEVLASELPLTLTPLSVRLADGVLTWTTFDVGTPAGVLAIGGSFDLAALRLDASGRGALDMRALSPWVQAASLSGTARIDLAVAGPLQAPEARGTVIVTEGAIRPREIPEALTEIEGRLRLEGSALRLEELRANLGGGSVTAEGWARLSGVGLEDARFDIVGRDLNLRYPLGLRSRLDADLSLLRETRGFVLRGAVRGKRGLYDLDTALQTSSSFAAVEPAASPLLRAIGLDVEVTLETPVLVRHKLAHLDVDGSLLMRGDLETPVPTGGLDLAPGGKLYVQAREFVVQSGRLAYVGDWDPEVSLLASSRVRDDSDLASVERDVTLRAGGRLSTSQPELSAPGLSSGQVISLVATGRSSGSTLGAGAQLAGQQAAALALGQVSRGLGLDEVVVSPELLAREIDPGARFTFGKHLTRMVSLIYSLSLQGPEQRFVQIEARLPRSLTLRGQRTDDGVYALGVGQQLRVGGTRAQPARDESVRLAELRFEGEWPERARESVRARVGRRLTPWDVQEDADRARKALSEEGFLEAQVSGRLQDDVAVLHAKPGPRFGWRVTGMTNPPDLAPVFGEALFEEDAADRGRLKLLEVLRKRGFLRARVPAARAVVEGVLRVLVFEVLPGEPVAVEVRMPGAERLSPEALLAAAGGSAALLVEPGAALARIDAAYRSVGFPEARSGPLASLERDGRVLLTLPIEEGPAARLARIEFSGASRSEAELRAVSRLVTNDAFEPAAIDAAVSRLREAYHGTGQARAEVKAKVAFTGSQVDVVFEISEAPVSRIQAVEILGLGRTREALVRRKLRLRRGDPVDPKKLLETERRLLELGIFSHVAVSASPEEQATLRIEVAEREPLLAAYELRWSDEKQATAQVDGEARSLLGIGLDLGARYLVGRDDREKRASLALPSPLRGRFTVTAFETQRDESITDIFTGEPITNTQTERVLEFQQSLRVKRRTNLLAGYRFRSVFSTVFEVPIHIASLDLSGARDARDNPLDASAGSFTSLSLELSPQSLGSDLTFAKAFGQLFLHRPLSPSWTWSSAYRLGLARGFSGQGLIPSERFRVGGADSLRGFAQNAVGPRDILGEPAGGEALLVGNQELRFRPSPGYGLVAFWDFGNVFARVEDLSLELRHDLGLGLRWLSPVGLLRFDLAFPLARRDAEARARFNFSLGQAF